MPSVTARAGDVSPPDADTRLRVRDMYMLYRHGVTLQEVGEDYGVSRQRVLQLFARAGLPTRSNAQTMALKREADRRRADGIVAAFRRTGDVAAVADELDVPKRTVTEVLRTELSQREYRTLTRKFAPPPRKIYTDEELIDFLRQASTAVTGRLGIKRYDALARTRHTPDGRPWPTSQTAANRFGSWRAALQAADLQAHSHPGAGSRRRFTAEQCIAAVRTVQARVQRPLTGVAYARHAHASGGELPSLSTVRLRCGCRRWDEVMGLVEGGEASQCVAVSSAAILRESGHSSISRN